MFSQGVNEIAEQISLGMKDYEKGKAENVKFFDE